MPCNLFEVNICTLWIPVSCLAARSARVTPRVVQHVPLAGKARLTGGALKQLLPGVGAQVGQVVTFMREPVATETTRVRHGGHLRPFWSPPSVARVPPPPGPA